MNEEKFSLDNLVLLSAAQQPKIEPRSPHCSGS